MSSRKFILAGLIGILMLAGCLIVPGPHGRPVAVVPFLPPVVELGPEPYYVHEGYFYHYHNNGWYYSRSRGGPWVDLPRDHYPREVRFKNRERGEYRGR